MAHVTGDAATSGARGHVGGEDVIGVPVEVLAGPVIARGRAGIGVPGGDLDIAQVNSRIQHGRDEGVPEHVGMWPGDPYARVLGEAAQAAGRGVPQGFQIWGSESILEPFVRQAETFGPAGSPPSRVTVTVMQPGREMRLITARRPVIWMQTLWRGMKAV